MRTRADQIRFSELTRVQIPAVLHLIRIGYTYLSRKSQEIIERVPKRIFWYLFLENSIVS